MSKAATFKPEKVKVSELKPHPRNYRGHTDDQLDHLIQSIEEHGLYRNVVVAKDGTILAGHGVVLAAKKKGLKQIPVIRLDIEPDSPKALKVLTSDNEIAHLAEVDDRLLSELLKEVKDTDVDGLLGTGYDENMLAALVMITRPASEIEDFDAAGEWVGMPEYGENPPDIKVMVNFDSFEDKTKFGELIGIPLNKKSRAVRWPDPAKRDLDAVRFEQEEVPDEVAQS